MSDITRRGFVKGSAGAAAGVGVLGALLAEAAAEAEAHGEVGARPIIAYVRNPKRGAISVMTAGREVTIHDRRLAARLARAVR